MNIALDLGSHRIRSLRREGERLWGTSQRCAYSVLPDSSQQRQFLDQAGVRFAISEQGLLLVGDAAERHANLFKSICRTLLVDGRLPKEDPLARQVVGLLIESALPDQSIIDQQSSAAPICSFTVPGGIDIDATGARPDLEFISRCIQLRGFQPKLVQSGVALVLAELSGASFTGIGLVFGDSGCEAVLAHRGIPVCHARTEFGGQWLDRELADKQQPVEFNSDGEKFLNVSKMSSQKQRVESIVAPKDSFANTVADLLTKSCVRLVDEFRGAVLKSPQAADLPQPLPIVCSGGTTQIPGFDALIREVAEYLDFGIQVQPPRLVQPSEYTIARGLLIDAELDAHANRKVA